MPVSIEYIPNSFAGVFSEREFHEFEDYIARDVTLFRFDPTYVDHIRRFHGGVPVVRKFVTKAGKKRSVERFLNFVDRKSKENEAIIYANVNVIWSSIEDRLGLSLIPFAELRGGDFLCFDIQDVSHQTVVCWFHELSREDRPYKEQVADSFEDFLAMLHS
jgi:hypothetical protein